MQEGGPQDGDYSVCLEPMEQAAVVNANRGLFQSSTQIKEQYEEGMMGRMAGADWYMDQNVASHTTGARGGAAIVTTASQVGSSHPHHRPGRRSGTRLQARRRDSVYRRVCGQSADARRRPGGLRDFTVTAT